MRVGAELAGTLDVGQVTDRLARAVIEIFGVKRAAVYRLRSESGDLVCVAGATAGGRDSHLPWIGQVLPRGTGVSGRAVAERRVVACPDQLADPGLTFPAWAIERVRQERYRSGTAVPLIVRDEVLGALYLGDTAGRLLPGNRLSLLSAFADRAAVAIHAARLHERLGERLDRLQALARIDELLLSSLDRDEILAEIARAAATLMGAAQVRVWFPDESREALVEGAVAGKAAAEGFPVRRIRFGEGGAGWVAEHRRPLEVPDIAADERILERPWFLARGFTSAVLLPILDGERLLGVLSLIGRAGFRLDADDRSLLQGLVAQSALALRNVRLFEESERRRRESEILADVVADINASRDLDSILERVGEGARELCRSDLAGVALREPASGAVVFSHWPGARQDYGRVRVEPGRGVGGLALATGRPVRTECYLEDPRITQEYRDLAVGEGIVAAMAVPIAQGGRVEGLLYVHNRSPRPFSDADEVVLVRLAEHAARAIGNARLTEALRTRRAHLEAVLEASRELSRIQPVETLLGRITELCGRLLDSSSVGIRLVEGDELVIGGGWGDAGQIMITPRLRFGQSLSGVVAATGEPLLVDDIAADPRVEPAHRDAALRAGYSRWMGVPLKAGDRVLGVLSVRRGGDRPFADAELAVATAFASQAAAALENARLYREAREAYASLERTQAQLGQSQKMEAVGRLAGGIAHDFNNLLTVVLGRSELALARLREDDPLRRDLGLIQTTSQRAAKLVSQLLAFSRKQVLHPQVIDMGAVVAGIEGMLRRLIGEDIDLRTRSAPGCVRVKADPGQIEQVIVNLVVNARDAMPEGGRLDIEVADVELTPEAVEIHEGLRPGAYVRLSVRDTGHGMDAETRARIFEPFFTTKEVGKGTGLGLATVYGIVKQSDGYIFVDSEPGRGTAFTIYLPRVEEEGEPASAGAPPPPLGRGAETILLVEDDPGLRALALDVLGASGYTVLEAREGSEALLVLERHAGPIHLLLTDVVMPNMGGRALAERLATLRPEMAVLYMSGYSETAIAHHGVLTPGTAFLAKPFSPDSLARKVREVLDASGSRPLA